MPLARLGLAPLPVLAAPGPGPQKRQVTAVPQPLSELAIKLQVVEPKHYLLLSLKQFIASFHFHLLQLIRIRSWLHTLHFCHMRNKLELLWIEKIQNFQVV